MDEGKFNSTFLIPTHLTSDYIQIVCLILTFCTGVPLNVYTFTKLSRQYYVTKSRILLFSLHLNVSDLMILFFFVFPKVCWLFTYQWLGGTILCKLIKFVQTLSVALSSNVIVCIGLDRLVSLKEPLLIRAAASCRCKKMLLAAWLLAVCCSAPQLQVWTILEPSINWGQCTDMWTVWEYRNISSPTADMVKTVYEMSHIIVLFWLPLTIVIICYVIILKLAYRNLGNDQEIRRNKSRNNQGIRTKFSSSNNQLSSNSSRKTTRESAASVFKKSTGFGSTRNQCKTRQKPQPNLILRRNISRTQVKRTKYRTLKITVTIIMAYLVFWLPYNVLTVWHLAHIKTYVQYVDKYLYFFYNLIAVNVVVNPLIYSRFSFFFCGRKKNTRTVENVDSL